MSQSAHARRMATPAVAAALLFVAGLLPAAPIPPAVAASTTVVINEFRVRGPNGGSDEFVELRNISTGSVAVGGWKLRGSNAAGTISTRATIPDGVSIAAGCYYLFTNSSTSGGPYSGSVAGDQTYATGVTDDGGLAITLASDAVVDAVGMSAGSAFKEGTPLASLGSSNLDRGYARNTAGADTDANSTDFTLVTPSGPQNAASCQPDAAPSVTSSVPANGATGVPANQQLSVTFSEDVALEPAGVTIACNGTAIAAIQGGGPRTFTFDHAAFPVGASCSLTVDDAAVTDADATDPPDTMAGDFAITFTVAGVANVCGNPATFIHDIQGTGAQSGLVGQVRTVEAVVVGDYQGTGQFSGYHLQEEVTDADTDPATSEGIFVFNTSLPVSVGDKVRVTGTVAEFASSGGFLTQLSNVTSRLQCSTGNGIAPTDVDLPIASIATWERYESMLVAIDQELTVTETFGLGRFGEVALSVGGRLLNPTAVVEPGSAANARQALNDRSRILLDDGVNLQNIDPTKYPQGTGGLSASNTLRSGDTVASLQGVLEQRFGVYRVQPVDPALITFDHDNPRPAAPAAVGGNLQVAAMNVLNYFTSLDDPSLGDDPARDICGPTGGQECRGADSPLEFQRQRAKVVSAILGLDADVVGLMEIENNPSASLEDLVQGLNDATAPGTWDFIDTGTIGSDAIKVGLIYRPGDVTAIGAHAILDSSVDERFIDSRNRPALAQTFELAGGGGRLTVVVNHLKSKGSACTGEFAAPLDDPDQGDGQGNCPETRRLAAEALVDWIATDPTASGDRDVLVIGDLNAYAKEDPIDVFVRDTAGSRYTNLIEQALGEAGYSFVFQGQSGYLDHALASPTLAAQVTGATEWHVNADEPIVLDYNTEFKSANHVDTLYEPDEFRSSDHDPLLVGIQLVDYDFGGLGSPVDPLPTINSVKAGSSVPLKFTLVGDRGLDVFFSPPAVELLACSGGPTDEIETTTSGGGGLQYDPATDTYTYVWKTQKAWAGSCGTLHVVFRDGSYQDTAFQFK